MNKAPCTPLVKIRVFKPRPLQVVKNDFFLVHRKDQPFWLRKFVKCCFYFWKLQLRVLKSLLSGWHWHTQKHLDNFPTWSVLRTEFMMSFCTPSWHISGTNLSSDKPFSNLMDKVAKKSEGLQACPVGIVIVIDTQKFRNMQGTSQFLHGFRCWIILRSEILQVLSKWLQLGFMNGWIIHEDLHDDSILFTQLFRTACHRFSTQSWVSRPKSPAYPSFAMIVRALEAVKCDG